MAAAAVPVAGRDHGRLGGGYDVGIAALPPPRAATVGPQTILESAVPEYFGLVEPFDSPGDPSRAAGGQRLGELARVVFPVAAQDGVAASIVERLTDEIVAFASVAVRRLGLAGGPRRGARRRPDRAASAERRRRVAAECRGAPLRRTCSSLPPPIVGATLLAFDDLGLNSTVVARARAELDAAFARIEGDGLRDLGGRPTDNVRGAQALSGEQPWLR
jgi:hypothetical protein